MANGVDIGAHGNGIFCVSRLGAAPSLLSGSVVLVLVVAPLLSASVISHVLQPSADMKFGPCQNHSLYLMVCLSLAVGFLSSWVQSMLSLGGFVLFHSEIVFVEGPCVFLVFSWYTVALGMTFMAVSHGYGLAFGSCAHWSSFLPLVVYGVSGTQEGSLWGSPAAPSLPGNMSGEFLFQFAEFEPRDCFVAIAAAMLMTPRAICVCFQVLGYGGGQGPVFVMRGFCPAGCDAVSASYASPTLSLCSSSYGEHFRVRPGWLFLRHAGCCWIIGVCLSFLRIPGYLISLGGGLLKREDQRYTRVLLWSLKKRLPFFPQANQVFFDSSLTQVAGIAAAAFLAALLNMVAHQFCSCIAAAFVEQEKATPRVDVAETPQASPFLEAQGKTFIQSGPSLVSSRSLLVRALTGQTLVVRWSSSEDVLHCVSERTGVPLHAFYLTLNGKCLTEETLHSMDRSSPIPLVMHGRLRGGSSSVPGDWVCSRCHIGGCWPTKSRCYRCGAPRHSASQDVGPTLPRRESLHPGRAPKPKPAPVNPTFREPRVIPPKRGGTPPAASAPSPVSTASQLDPTAIVTLLRSLGLTEDLLSQVRAAFPPPPAQNPKKEQRLLQLRGQIDSAKKHVDRLDRSVAHHRSQLQTCLEN